MTKRTGAPEKSSYRRKQERGLVPYLYDRDSKRFHMGAFKNWPSGDPLKHPALARYDAEFLANARENR